jgi:hypothetical protein
VTVATVRALTVLPSRLTVWPVVLALLTAAPFLVGAWRWLRR